MRLPEEIVKAIFEKHKDKSPGDILVILQNASATMEKLDAIAKKRKELENKIYEEACAVRQYCTHPVVSWHDADSPDGPPGYDVCEICGEYL